MYDISKLCLKYIYMNDYQANIKIEIQPGNGKPYKLIKLTGNLDKAGLAAVREQIESAESKMSDNVLVFDFSGLNFINSEGIGFFMMINHRLIQNKKKMVIVGATDNVRDVLNVIGLLNIIESFPSLVEMEAGLKT